MDCQVVLSGNTSVSSAPKGVRHLHHRLKIFSRLLLILWSQDYLSLNFGWAVGTAMGVWVAGGVSGGHINPAVNTFQFFNKLT